MHSVTVTTIRRITTRETIAAATIVIAIITVAVTPDFRSREKDNARLGEIPGRAFFFLRKKRALVARARAKTLIARLGEAEVFGGGGQLRIES